MEKENWKYFCGDFVSYTRAGGMFWMMSWKVYGYEKISAIVEHFFFRDSERGEVSYDFSVKK